MHIWFPSNTLIPSVRSHKTHFPNRVRPVRPKPSPYPACQRKILPAFRITPKPHSSYPRDRHLDNQNITTFNRWLSLFAPCNRRGKAASVLMPLLGSDCIGSSISESTKTRDPRLTGRYQVEMPEEKSDFCDISALGSSPSPYRIPE